MVSVPSRARSLPVDITSAQRYLNISEAAAELGVSRVTIWRWIRDGLLPARRLGHRTVRIRGEDLDQLVANGVSHNRPASDFDLARPDHAVRFYENGQVLATAAGDFIGAALGEGEAGIVIATERHRAGIEQQLQTRGVDVAGARASGRYTSLNAVETLMRIMADGEPDPTRFADVVGNLVARVTERGHHVRIFGEMVAVLVEQGNHAGVIRLEELWNELKLEHDFSLMCGYQMEDLRGESLSPLMTNICALHEHVEPTETYLRLVDPGDRLRNVAELQQKARSLELEVALRQQAEQRLHSVLASEQRKERELRDFVETAPLGMHWIARDGTILWANQAELDALGYARSEFIGHNIADFHVSRQVALTMLACLERGEALREYPAELRCKDDSIRHVLFDASVLWEDAQFVHTRCFTRDVTDLRRVEQERRVLLESEQVARHAAQNAVERTRRLQEITEQLSRSLEPDEVLHTIARSAADLVAAPVGAVFLLELGDRARDFVLAAAHGIEESRAPDLRLPRWASLAGRAIDEGQTLIVDDVRDTPGTALPALLTGETAGSEIAAPIVAGDMRLGVVKAFSPTVRRFNDDDAALLTSLAAAAAVALTNARLYREAQDGIDARDEFLSTAAHDLNTPLASVKATAQLLRRKLVREETPDLERLLAGLASIDATATKMGQQLDELLDVTRLHMGERLELRREPVDLVELVQRVASEHQQLSERHRIRVEALVPELIANVDGVRLARVLDNLLSNAIKYSPAGGDVRVGLACEHADGTSTAVLAVEDHGLGIPAADLPRIFDRFNRATNVKGRIGGTGIGLASAQQIVQYHGGTISVESREGEGSTFTVRLALDQPGA